VTDNPVELAEEAVAWRVLGDEFLARSRAVSARAVEAMKARGTLYPSFSDGTEMATFAVPKGEETVSVDPDRLLPFVKAHYPTEVYEVVRPAFIDRVRQATREAKAPCGPGGEADITGVTYSPAEGSGAPRITARPEARVRARAAVDAVVDRMFGAFAAPQQLEGGDR
jgi:hypothetical protein